MLCWMFAPIEPWLTTLVAPVPPSGSVRPVVTASPPPLIHAAWVGSSLQLTRLSNGSRNVNDSSCPSTASNSVSIAFHSASVSPEYFRLHCTVFAAGSASFTLFPSAASFTTVRRSTCFLPGNCATAPLVSCGKYGISVIVFPHYQH